MDSSILDKWDALHARVHRWRWWTRLAVAAVIVPLFWPFARSRMNTPPADPNALGTWHALNSTPPGCEDLLAAFAKIPPLPALPALPPAPAGQHWEPAAGNTATLPLVRIDPAEALRGPWTPRTRHHLAAIVAYVTTPALEAALDEVAARTLDARPMVDIFGPFSQFRAVAKIHCVRARYHLAERRDPVAAARDIRQTLELCDLLERGGTLIQHFVAAAIRDLTYEVIIKEARRIPLTQPQLKELLAALQAHPFDFKARWRSAKASEARYAAGVVDVFYTRGADGNGWFVPHTPEEDDLAERARCLLNLLSPIVNDRRTVLGKIQFVVDRTTRACDLPFREGIALLGDGPVPDGLGNPADGPCSMDWAYTRHMYRHFAHCMAGESAAITAIALSAYRAEHGSCPAQLSDLAPQYLTSLPIDPVTGGPLRYRLDERDGYSLYSPGEDCIDDGGRLRDAHGELIGDPADWLFCGREPVDGSVEWYLVPDDTGQQSATTRPE